MDQPPPRPPADRSGSVLAVLAALVWAVTFGWHHLSDSREAPALATAVDLDQVVAIYRELYPLFQQAYTELGHPGHHFNDRQVDVLDHLIATPMPDGPLGVTLVEVKGPVPSTRPWVRYEFTVPALVRLSAGQKKLLRSGAENQRQLQSVLVAVRSRLARP